MGPLRFLRRLDSLFLRLLLTQLALVGALGVVIGSLFYVERSTNIATLYAELWAPQLAQAAGLADFPAAPTRAGPVLRMDSEPPRTRSMPGLALRFTALRNTLGRHGVLIDEVRLNNRNEEPVVWVHVVNPQAAPVWLGMPGRMLPPEWPLRVLLALGAVVVLLVLASWSFTRRLTRPLEQLRARMQTLATSTGEPLDNPTTALPKNSSPEIAAIDAAYTEALARLAQHQRERAVLLAGVSHDLRSPLGRIRMAAELLPDAPDTRVRKESITRNVVVADRLIESFLDYVRSDALAFDETVDLAEVVRTVAARCEPPHVPTVSAPAHLPWPQTNALLVERLVSNLVDNAFKHGQAPVHIRLHEEVQAQELWLEVSDAGMGFAAENAALLQEAFSRGASSRSIPGTGLGLAIVRQIATRMGGQVEFITGPSTHTVRIRFRRPTT